MWIKSAQPFRCEAYIHPYKYRPTERDIDAIPKTIFSLSEGG
jgi:hypothetical protein